MRPPYVALEADKYPREYFDQHAYAIDPRRAQMYRQERDRLEEYVSGGRILDVGCGLGVFLAEFDPQRWERHGTDISDYACEQARLHGVTVRCQAEWMDYPAGHFDCVVLRGVLQHLYNPLETLHACERILKPGGTLAILATPNTRSPVYTLFGDLPALDAPRNWFTASDLTVANILTNLGLHVEKIYYPYFGTPYASPLRDLWRFALRVAGIKQPFAFWRSMMEVYARKPNQQET